MTACGDARTMVVSQAANTINLVVDEILADQGKDEVNNMDCSEKKHSPCSATLTSTVQWRKRIADADVPEKVDEKCISDFDDQLFFFKYKNKENKTCQHWVQQA